MKEFKIRASAAGKLLTNPRSKSESLSQTTKSYVEEWLKEQIYGVKRTFTSKYTEKGQRVELDSLEYAKNALKRKDEVWGKATKNEQSFEDDFFTGTPDIILPDRIVDIKSSWDCFTFPAFEVDIPNRDYDTQLQVYMHLTGKKQAELVYVLIDTPEDLTDVVYVYDEFIPQEYRVKRFFVEYDEEVIAKLQDRVEACRDYVDELMYRKAEESGLVKS